MIHCQVGEKVPKYPLEGPGLWILMSRKNFTWQYCSEYRVQVVSMLNIKHPSHRSYSFLSVLRYEIQRNSVKDRHNMKYNARSYETRIFETLFLCIPILAGSIVSLLECYQLLYVCFGRYLWYVCNITTIVKSVAIRKIHGNKCIRW